MTSADQERFHRIRRETGNGYGITLKDLAWLVRLAEKLIADNEVEKQSPILLQPNDVRKMAGPFAPARAKRAKNVRRKA